MKVRYAESFLFPNSQDDFRRPETFYSHQGLHGLDAVAKGYYDTRPFEKTYQQDLVASYTKLLASQKADLANLLANPNLPGAGYSINFLLQQIPFSESQIATATEALREDPEINARAEQNSRDLAQKLNDAEMAKALAAQAQQSANFVIAYGSGEGADLETARILQQQADDYARQAAENKAAADNLEKQRLQQQAAEAAQFQIFQQQIATEASKNLADLIRPYVAAQPVVTPAVVAPATQTIQNTQGSLKMRNLSDIDIMVLDVQNGQPALIVGWPDGGYEYVAIGNQIDPWLTSHGFTRANVIENPAYTNLLATQTAEVRPPTVVVTNNSAGTVTTTNPTTGTVTTTSPTTGATTTANVVTGAVTVTTPAGQTVSGTGSVTAGNTSTTVNQATGTVTTTNTTTGATTVTNAATGQSQTGTAAPTTYILDFYDNQFWLKTSAGVAVSNGSADFRTPTEYLSRSNIALAQTTLTPAASVKFANNQGVTVQPNSEGGTTTTNPTTGTVTTTNPTTGTVTTTNTTTGTTTTTTPATGTTTTTTTPAIDTGKIALLALLGVLLLRGAVR